MAKTHVELSEERGALRSSRTCLLIILDERFGTLDKTLIERINAIRDLESLRAVIRQSARIASLDQLHI